MYQSVAVEVDQGSRRLNAEINRFSYRKGLALSQDLPQALSRDQLHAEKTKSVMGMQIKYVDHVVMPGPRRPDLAPQTFVVELAGELGVEDLDRDLLPHPGVEGRVDPSRATAAEEVFDEEAIPENFSGQWEAIRTQRDFLALRRALGLRVLI